jgi:3-oxoacyl-[acyl-carrier protein] reductase
MFELTGKTALVTGATGTIGGSIARTLHAQGATVAISGTRREVLDRLAADLGDRVHVLPCNLADHAETERWCRAPRRRWVSSTCLSPMPA